MNQKLKRQTLNLDDLDFINSKLDDLDSVVGGETCTGSPALATTPTPSSTNPTTAGSSTNNNIDALNAVSPIGNATIS